LGAFIATIVSLLVGLSRSLPGVAVLGIITVALISLIKVLVTQVFRAR